MDSFFIFGAKYLFLVSPIVALVIFWMTPREYKKRFIIFALIFLVASFLVGKGLGMLYSHQQPFAVEHFTPLIPHAVDNSFPSDHTLFAAAIAGVVWFYSRRAGLWLFLVAVVVGLSRVYAGLHYPIDIVVSLAIPLLFVLILRIRRGSQENHPV